MGYIMGKVEGKALDWHAHITALSIAPVYRRLGIANLVMYLFEELSESVYDCYFVDLFVRMSNKVAIDMYSKLGYVVYRRVLDYYSGGADIRSEDAFGTNYSRCANLLLIV